ncbi:unnamed protein product [Arctogadus glacialis]
MWMKWEYALGTGRSPTVSGSVGDWRPGVRAGSTTQKTALALPGHAIAELFILPHLIFDTLATTVEAEERKGQALFPSPSSSLAFHVKAIGPRTP